MTAGTPKPPRMQVNLRPVTQRMVRELVEHMRTYSVQPDLKNSELFDALVAALYQAREELDLSAVPARGQWGSPTATAFLDALARAFSDAIAAQAGQV